MKQSSKEIQFVANVERKYYDDMKRMLKNEWWAKDRTVKQLETILTSSQLTFALINTTTDRLIGFARVLTDYIDTTLLLDVVIDSEYRDRKLGTLFLAHAIQSNELTGIKNNDLHWKNDLDKIYGCVALPGLITV